MYSISIVIHQIHYRQYEHAYKSFFPPKIYNLVTKIYQGGNKLMINSILNLLRSDGYITVHKTLIRNIGLVSATLFSELCSKYKYFLDNGQLRNSYFYYTIPDCEKELGLGRREQDSALNKLVSLGLIEKKAMKFTQDNAPKRYIKITDNINLLLKYFNESDKKTEVENIANTGFVQNVQIEKDKKDNSNCAKCTPSNTNINNTNYNNQSVSPSHDIDIEPEGDKTNELTNLFSQCEVELYEDKSLKETIKETIITAYNDTATRETIKKIKLVHIDEALRRYREAQETKEIKNPKLYFKKTLVSAILEEGLKGLF